MQNRTRTRGTSCIDRSILISVLQAEVRRRSEADKKLQGHLDSELRRLQERLADEMREWQETMKASVDGLAKDVLSVQKSLRSAKSLSMAAATILRLTHYRDEKAERDAEIESLTQGLSSRIEECTVGLEDGTRALHR